MSSKEDLVRSGLDAAFSLASPCEGGLFCCASLDECRDVGDLPPRSRALSRKEEMLSLTVSAPEGGPSACLRGCAVVKGRDVWCWVRPLQCRAIGAAARVVDVL